MVAAVPRVDDQLRHSPRLGCPAWDGSPGRGDGPGSRSMNKLCIFIGMTVLGWIGWWIGDKAGDVTGYVLSGIGSLAGAYVGWRINCDCLG